MTNTEARQILIDCYAWNRGIPSGKTYSIVDIDTAIDAAISALGESDDLTIAYLDGYDKGKRSKSSIAQAIRDAAVNWPQFLGDVECQILHAFCDDVDVMLEIWNDEIAFRTFMLLVAEALES